MTHPVNANAEREFSKYHVHPIGLVTIHLPPKRCLTITDFTLAAGDILEIDINSGTDYQLEEGVDWFAVGSNAQSAVNLALAINALPFGSLPRVRARAEGERVIVAGGATTTTLAFDLTGIDGVEELIDPAPATREFFLGDRSVIGPAGGEWGGIPLSVANLPKPVSHKIDALTREFSSGDRDIEWIDDGEIRRILLDQHLRGRRIDVSIGTPNLAQADFHPLGGAFYIEDVKPASNGSIEMKCHDAAGFFKDNQLAKRWVNEAPIDILRDALETVALQWGLGAGLTALDELVDRTTLVPSIEPETEHFTISRYDDQAYETGKPLDEPEPLIDIMNELLLLLGGTFSPDVNGRYRYRPYVHSAAAVRTWQADPLTGYDVEDVAIKDSWGNIANEIGVDFAESQRAHAGLKTRFASRSEDSRNEVGRLFQTLLETDWCNGVCQLAANSIDNGGFFEEFMAPSCVSFVAELAARQGFTGSRFRLQGDGTFLPEAGGDLDGGAAPPRRAFFRFHGPGREAGTGDPNSNREPEIIACDDSEPEGNIHDDDNVRGDIPRHMRFFVATGFSDAGLGFVNGRAGFDTTTPNQWNLPPTGGQIGIQKAWIVDITIPVEMVVRRLPRFHYGAPVLEVRTSLDQIAIEVGDFIAIQGDHVYMSLGKDGLTTTSIFEVTSVDLDPWGDNPGISFELTWVRDDVVQQIFAVDYPVIDTPIFTPPAESRVLTDDNSDVLTDDGNLVLAG